LDVIVDSSILDEKKEEVTTHEVLDAPIKEEESGFKKQKFEKRKFEKNQTFNLKTARTLGKKKSQRTYLLRLPKRTLQKSPDMSLRNKGIIPIKMAMETMEILSRKIKN
jgi:hypothetical protein